MASTTETRFRDEPAAGAIAGHLRLDEPGFALLGDRLARANGDNPDFPEQRDRLLGAVRWVLLGLQEHFAEDIVVVLATGQWAERGVDLRLIGDAEDVVLRVVVARPRADFDLNTSISSRIISRIRPTTIEHFLLQFDLMPLPLWEHALESGRRSGRSPAVLGIPLLVRECAFLVVTSRSRRPLGTA